MDDIVYVDFEDGVKRMMNNVAFYIKMLKKFKENTSLKDIETAIAEEDLDKAKIAAHTFKGLVGNLSLTELYKQSQDLEAQLKGGNLAVEQLALVKEVNNQTIMEVEKVISQHE